MFSITTSSINRAWAVTEWAATLVHEQHGLAYFTFIVWFRGNTYHRLLRLLPPRAFFIFFNRAPIFIRLQTTGEQNLSHIYFNSDLISSLNVWPNDRIIHKLRCLFWCTLFLGRAPCGLETFVRCSYLTASISRNPHGHR